MTPQAPLEVQPLPQLERGNPLLILYTYQGQKDDITAIAWSPNGKLIASGDMHNHMIKIWGPQTGTERKTLQASDWITSLAWSPNGTQIASSSYDGTVQMVDAQTGTTHATYAFSTHPMQVRVVAWSPDGKYIAAASDDGKVRLWPLANPSTHTPQFTFTNKDTQHLSIPTMAWSPNGKSIASADYQAVDVWQPALSS